MQSLDPWALDVYPVLSRGYASRQVREKQRGGGNSGGGGGGNILQKGF